MPNLFNRIIKYSICSLVFLLPLFWLPFSFEFFEYNKQYLLLFLVSIVFFLWLAKQVLLDKEIKFRRTPLDLPILGFLLVAILSAIFSVDKSSSLFGFYGKFSDGLINILSAGLMYFLITNNVEAFSREKSSSLDSGKLKVKNVEKKEGQSLSIDGIIRALTCSVWLITLVSYFSIFGVWQKLFSGKLPSVMMQRIFNPAAASMEGLAVFLGVVAVFLAGYLITVKQKRLIKIFDAALFLAVLILLVIIDFTPTWILIIVSLFFFLIFSLSRRIFKENVNRLLIPISLLFIAVFFTFFNTTQLVQTAISRPTVLNTLPKEQVLSEQQSWHVALRAPMENVKSIFLGSGIGTWHYDFAKFKSVDFNKDPMWQIRFDRAGNYIAELLGTMGALGFLSYFFLIAIFSLISWLILNQKTQDLTAGFQLPLLAAFLALLVGQFVYYQNTVLFFSFWLILALSVVSWQKPAKEHIFSFKEFPEMALVFSIVLTIAGLTLFIAYFFAVKFYLADVHYRNAIKTGQIQELERAVALNPGQPFYKIILARSYFNEVMAAMQKPADQQQSAALAEKIYLSITYLKGGQIGGNQVKGATELAPNMVAGWETLGMIYRDIQGAVTGSLDWATKSLERALVLDPNNPVLHTELGKLYLAANDSDKAKKEFQKAKSLKPDYLDASIQISLLLEKENNFPDAIRELESLANANPYNLDVLFQLGRLYFNGKQTDNAIAQFEKILAYAPNDSNTLYSLGIAYQAKGDNEKAIVEFEKVLALNPGNADVQAKLDELKGVKKEAEK